MVGYGDVRRWRPGPLDGAEQQLKARSDALPWLADDLSRASAPNGWHGLAADTAAIEQARLADGIEHIVAGVSAARTALMAASDGVAGLQHLVSEADSLAQAYDFSINDAGEVVDPGLPPDVPTEHADAVRQERAKIKTELLDRVQQILTRAEEIDNSLANLLGRIERGEIHDGGATSLAAAADAGAAQGVMEPSIPAPPPNPPTDPGAGEHGSDPWYSRGDDLFMRDAAGTAAMFADGIGWTHASAHLRHYLDNSGTDLAVSPDEMMRDVDRFRSEVDKTTAAEMRRIAADAEANGTYGKPTQFSSEWKGEYIGPEDSKDWYYAMGGVQYSVTGVATAHPPEQPGGEPRIEMDYKTHVFDRYNWDGGKETDIGPVTISDDSMAEMHRAGVAQEFNMSGSTEAKHYAGTVPPPGQRPELPAPPDNRDGTRTDPGR